jgi:hypothetical protein
MANKKSMIPVEAIERRILLIRSQKIMLDSDLAQLYGVPTKRLMLIRLFQQTPIGCVYP